MKHIGNRNILLHHGSAFSDKGAGAWPLSSSDHGGVQSNNEILAGISILLILCVECVCRISLISCMCGFVEKGLLNIFIEGYCGFFRKCWFQVK